MKKFSGIPAVLLALALIFTGVPAAAEAQTSADYVAGQAIVCLKTAGMRLTPQDTDGFSWETLMDVSAADAQDVLSESASMPAMHAASAGSDKELVLVKSDSLSTEELISRLEERDDVLFAEPDYITSVDWDESPGTLTAQSAAADYSSFQWGLSNDGTMADGVAGYDIGNTDNLHGSSGVVIAVADTGISMKRHGMGYPRRLTARSIWLCI